jgi:hypothetical protein
MARDEIDDDPAEPVDGMERYAADGLAHLQAAAREMIAAARALLDAAEGLVDDPNAVTAMVDTVGSVVRGAAKAVVGPAPGTRRDGDDGGYERIRVG